MLFSVTRRASSSSAPKAGGTACASCVWADPRSFWDVVGCETRGGEDGDCLNVLWGSNGAQPTLTGQTGDSSPENRQIRRLTVTLPFDSVLPERRREATDGGWRNRPPDGPSGTQFLAQPRFIVNRARPSCIGTIGKLRRSSKWPTENSSRRQSPLIGLYNSLAGRASMSHPILPERPVSARRPSSQCRQGLEAPNRQGDGPARDS